MIIIYDHIMINDQIIIIWSYNISSNNNNDIWSYNNNTWSYNNDIII